MVVIVKVGIFAGLVLGCLVGCTYIANSLWGSDGLAVAPLWLATLGTGCVMLVRGRRLEIGAGLIGGSAAFLVLALKYLGDFAA